MTISNGYVTLDEYKLYAQITASNTNDDAVIEDLVEGASRMIDDLTGRTFYARTATKYFSVPTDGSRKLALDDDLLTITTLTNGNSDTISSSDYNLVPKNHPPYHEIRLKEAAGIYWELDGDGNSEFVISVAGTWGFVATAPDDIKIACLQITQQGYKRRFGENTGTVATITPGAVVVTPEDIPGSAWQVIKKYRKLL